MGCDGALDLAKYNIAGVQNYMFYDFKDQEG